MLDEETFLNQCGIQQHASSSSISIFASSNPTPPINTGSSYFSLSSYSSPSSDKFCQCCNNQGQDKWKYFKLKKKTLIL